MSEPYKRPDSPFYWYDFTVGGVRFRGSTETDRIPLARDIIAKLRSDAVSGRHYKQKQTITVNEACARYWLEYAQHLKSGENAVKYHLAHIKRRIGSGVKLNEINGDHVSRMVAHLRSRMENASVNRVLSSLRKMLTLAKEQWEMDVSDLKLRDFMLVEPEARTRWITEKEADKLIECAAPHLKPVIEMALFTGLRLNNILSMRWEQVNWPQMEMHFQIKSNIPGGKHLTLPITQPAAELLQALKPRKDGPIFLRHFKPLKNGFQRPPEPITKFRRSWATACEKAGLENFRFHDLRHTAASWMIQRGVPIDLVQDLLGHTQISTTKKYAHRDTKEKLAALEKLSQRRR